MHDGRETRFDVLHKPGGVGVSIAPAAAPAGKRRYRLTVTAPAQGKADRERDFIIVKTDHPKARLLTLPVSFATFRANDPTAESTANATEVER